MALKIYKRWQAKKIKQTLKTRRVLLLIGPRQSGKTTLAKNLTNKKIIYRTLDDTTLLNAALDDPESFVRHGDDLMIIDEIQRAPLLLQAIKQNVDENEKPGRFLLTGSTHIQSLPSVKESLAGRITKIRLRPLTLGEIYGKQPSFIKKIFDGNFNSNFQQKRMYKDTYIKHAFNGGYPEPLRLKKYKDKKKWYKDYLEALIERDLIDISQIKRKDSLSKLVTILAAWSSKFMVISDIGKTLSISRATIQTYINALESLCLVERIKPWHKTDYDRVSKQEKIFMTDTGLMASLLNWQQEEVLLNSDKSGKLFETFIFHQLVSILEAQSEEYELYHYRDGEKREIDFIIKNEKGSILGIDVKAGSTVSKSSFKHLKWFGLNISKKSSFTGIILYTGQHVVSFGKNMWAIPISALWH